MNNILLILAAIGALLIIKDGFIFESLRRFIKNKAFSINNTLGIYVSKLISCAQCLGFWVGFMIFLIFSLLEQNYENIIIISIYFGFIISLLGYITDMLLTYLDEKIYSLQRKNEGKTDKD